DDREVRISARAVLAHQTEDDDGAVARRRRQSGRRERVIAPRDRRRGAVGRLGGGVRRQRNRRGATRGDGEQDEATHVDRTRARRGAIRRASSDRPAWVERILPS